MQSAQANIRQGDCRSGGTLDALRYVVRAGYFTNPIRLAVDTAWVPRGSQLA